MRGGNTSQRTIEQETSPLLYSFRSIFERFNSQKNTPQEYDIATDEYVLTASDFPDLPFPIAITDQGYTLCRVGEPLKEDTGKRVFIVDTRKLEEMYGNASISPERTYEELKKLDLGGRMLCGNTDSITISKDETPKWTIIVKKIDHPHKNHWKTPDLLRLDIDPTHSIEHQGTAITVMQRVVETESGFIRGTPLNLTNLTRDCELHFAEPWTTQASKADYVAFNERMEKMNATDEQREAALDEFDRANQLRRSNTNTLVLHTIRDHMGSIPAPPVEGFIRQDQNDGMLFLRINRTEGLYDRIMALTEDNTDRAQILRGLPKGMTLESLSSDSYGVNGIEINGILHIFSGKKLLEVPLLPEGTDRATVVLYFAAQSENRRKAMSIDVIRVNGRVIATLHEGIEEGEQVGFGTDQSKILFSYGREQKKQRDAKRQLGSIPATIQHTELTEEERLLKQEKAFRLSNPLAYSEKPPAKKHTILQR